MYHTTEWPAEEQGGHGDPATLPIRPYIQTGSNSATRYHSDMRAFAFALSCLTVATPVAAWEFTPVPICTLFHQGADMAVMVTYDPKAGEYAIHLSREGGWPSAAVFVMRFEGPRSLTISTTRHLIETEDTRTLTVRDRGFGNVLNGLHYNLRAVAVLGDLEVPVSLDGAAPAVEEFRACPSDQMVLGPGRSTEPQS